MVGEMKIFEMNGGREGQPFRTECSYHDGANFFRMLSKFAQLLSRDISGLAG